MHRILVAGNDILCSVEERIPLAAKGFKIVLTNNIRKSVAMILEDPPDLLIIRKGFENDGDLKLIRTVKGSIQKANIPVILMVSKEEAIRGLDWQHYPVDDFLVYPCWPEELLARIQLAQARMLRVFDNNPLSRLPGNTSILKAIQTALDASQSVAICYVDLDNFKPYNDRYGFSQGDDVILMVARIIVNVLEELARKDSFAGHIGGDDFVFIVPEDKATSVCERIIGHFEAVKNMFIDPADINSKGYVAEDRQGRETSYGLISLSIAVVTTGNNRFRHSGEVSSAASQLKHHVKSMEGSNFLIDRRRK